MGKNKINKPNAASLPDKLMEILNGFDEYYSAVLLGRHAHYAYLRRKLRSQYSQPSISTALYRMQKTGLVEKREGAKQIYYALTLDGETKLLLRSLRSEKKKREDGFSTVVIFDIPEAYSKHRGYLRRLLLANGFINLQKSVLIGPIMLPKQFYELLRRLKIEQYVSVLRAKLENWV